MQQAPEINETPEVVTEDDEDKEYGDKVIKKVGDHLVYMHWRLADKAMKMHTLEGKELNIHVKVMTLMSSRIADYKKYINLITFLQK